MADRKLGVADNGLDMQDKVDAIRGRITVTNEFYNYLIKCNGTYPSLENYDKSQFEIEGTRLTALLNPVLFDGELRIPLGVTEICDEALNLFRENLTAEVLQNKGKINRIIVPEGVETIGSKAFCGLYSLQSVYLPETLTSIGDSAFFGCSALKEVKIPETVTNFGCGIFGECRSLTKLTIPFIGFKREAETDNGNGKNEHTAVTVHGLGVLFSAENEKTDDTEHYYSPCTQTSLGSEGVSGKPVYSTNPLPYQIPKTLEEVIVSGDICYGAFEGFDQLVRVTLHGANDVPANAFKGCKSLTRLEFPDRLYSIGYDCLAGCDSLEYNEYGNALYLGNKKNRYEALIAAKEKASVIEVHQYATAIAPDAFKKSKPFAKVQLPDKKAKLPKAFAAVLKREKIAQLFSLFFLIFSAVIAAASVAIAIYSGVNNFERGSNESYIAFIPICICAALSLTQSFMFAESKYNVLKSPVPTLSGIGLGIVPVGCIGVGVLLTIGGGIISTVIILAMLVVAAVLLLLAFSPKNLYVYVFLLPQIIFAVAFLLFALNIRVLPISL
ncbi:MAG: leucine-rich repeat domain-containing protein [Clostridia bacterium]|nr:leucine-rich repeat domain-containing protein [Clostridia bacterium]